MAGSFIYEAAGWTTFDMPEDTLWYEPSESDREETVNDPENPFASLPDDVDPADIEGVWVHAYDLDNPENEHWFWVRTYMPLDWDQWNDLISLTLDMHGMSLA